MNGLLFVLNLAACGVIWAAALFFYLRHGRPACARHHFVQVALVLIAVGAFSVGMAGLRGYPVMWWEVLFRIGLAMLAGRAVVRLLRGQLEHVA